jgi:hypothetical protein
LTIAIVLSPAFWTVTLGTLLYLAIVYKENLIYLFYGFVGAIVMFFVTKAIRFMEKRHYRIMGERAMARYHARHGTTSKTDQM